MARRALAVVVGLSLLGACSEQSRVAPTASVTVRGTVEDVDGAPLADRAVRLGSGVSGLEGAAGALTFGVFCITGECAGDVVDGTSDEAGRYRFEMTGAETQSTFGEAESFLLSTSAPAHGPHATGPAVSARFRIQVEELGLPTLRLVDPALRLEATGPVLALSWQPAAPGPYVAGFTGQGRALVWEAPTAEPAVGIDGRVLEDAVGVATVAGARTEQAAGSDVTVHWRSPGLAYRGGFGAPPSRGAPCEAVDAAGAAAPLDRCLLTDGSFDVAGLLGRACPEPAAGAGASTRPTACAPVERVRIRLPRPVAAELLVVRGCTGACRVATVGPDGGPPVDAGPVAGRFATVVLGGGTVTAVDVVTQDPTSLAEVSVWGAVEGSALRPVEDAEALAPGPGDGEADRRVPAALATLALVGALVVLYRVRAALAPTRGSARAVGPRPPVRA